MSCSQLTRGHLPTPLLLHSLLSMVSLSSSQSSPFLFFPRCKLPRVHQATTSDPLSATVLKGRQPSRGRVHLPRSRLVISRFWHLEWLFRWSTILCIPLLLITPWSPSRVKCRHRPVRAHIRGRPFMPKHRPFPWPYRHLQVPARMCTLHPLSIRSSESPLRPCNVTFCSQAQSRKCTPPLFPVRS